MSHEWTVLDATTLLTKREARRYGRIFYRAGFCVMVRQPAHLVGSLGWDVLFREPIPPWP